MGIGNYKKPATNSDGSLSLPSSAAPPAQVTTGKTLVDAVEAGLQADARDTVSVVEKARTYEDILKEEGISEDEAHRIRDALLIDGYYSEIIELTPRTLVKLRTRSYLDYTRYHQAVERSQPRFITEREEIQMRFFLAASLEAYGGENFSFPETDNIDACEKAFDIRHKRVLKFPAPVVEMLCRHLNKFDHKVRVVLSEGAVEDF